MLDVLITGRVSKPAEQLTGKNSGKRYVRCTVLMQMNDGNSLFVQVTAFDEKPCRCLLALSAGDGIALSGQCTVRPWLDKDGKPRAALDMIAYEVLTPYHVSRKRNAALGTNTQGSLKPGGFDDQIPF